MDDAEGRREAERRQIRVGGTLGVLDEAGRRGLVDLQSALERLQQTNFRLSPTLISHLRRTTRPE